MNSPPRKTDSPQHPIDFGSRMAPNRGIRVLLLVTGGLSVALGTIGIFLPLLPTTPFLLLAAACYLRSSERFYNWLVSHPLLSKYLLAYLDGKGIPRKAKIYTTLPLWVSLTISAWLVPIAWVRIALVVIGIAVTIYVWRLPEFKVDT